MGLEKGFLESLVENCREGQLRILRQGYWRVGGPRGGGGGKRPPV